MWTAIKGHKKALKYLVEKCEVNLEICDSEGYTPLDQAIINANYDCAIYLKDKGCLVKSREFYEREDDRFFEHKVNLDAFLDSLEENSHVLNGDLFIEKEEKGNFLGLTFR